MQCITTVAYSVKFNGEHLPYFYPSRGLRQGDPLSPYIFILLANILSNLITQAVSIGHLKGIRLNRWCPTLSHLFFADNAIFFLHGCVQECQNLANILNLYCVATGSKSIATNQVSFSANTVPLPFRKTCLWSLGFLFYKVVAYI